MNCPRCGQLNPEDGGACSACGASLVHDADQPTRVTSPTSPDAPTANVSEAPTQATTTGSAAPAAALHPGQLLGTRYEIQALLGQGGFGAVYKAHDRSLDRTVALKVIRPDMALDSAMLERFKREILLASKITHPNVVRIHDLGEIDELKFISMNYVEGIDLATLLKREGPLPHERAMPIIRQVAEALQAAHQAGVVHRDLKPHNVLIDQEGNAFIADFGISRMEEQGKTMTEAGAILGTLAYMSPEQARGETADQRSDIYSFGLILYEVFSGELPFKAPSPLSSLMKRVHEDAPSLETSGPKIAPWMSHIVSRCLERDVEARYQSVGEILGDIDRQRATVKRRRRLGRRALGALAALLVAAAVVVAVVWALRTWEPPAPPVPKASLILVPFRNVTDDPRFDWARTGLPDLLRSDLEQVKSLRVVGDQRLREVADGLKLDFGGELQPAALERVSNLIGVEHLLTADLFRIGDRFRIEAHLLQTGSTGLTQDLPIRVEGTGEDSLFSMVDELSGRIQDELGVSRLWGSGREATELTTDSIEALRLYSEGVTLAREGSDLEATQRLEQALEVDPDFAAARAELAESLERLGHWDRALEQSELAATGLSKVSPYEAARIRAVRSRLAGDLEEATEAHRELTQLAPNRPESFMALAAFQEDTGDLESAHASLRRAIDLDDKNPNAHYVQGRVQVKLGKLSEALQEFNTALALQTEVHNDEGRATVLNGLGITYRELGRYDEALRQYEESLRIREAIGDRRGVAVTLNNIALVQMSQGQYDEAIETQQRSLEVGREIDDQAGIAESWANLGDIYAQAGRTEEALAAYQQEMRIQREVGDEASLARTSGNIGYIYTVLGRYNEAFMAQTQALSALRKLDDPGQILTVLIDIGLVEQVQGRYEQALEYYMEARSLAREIPSRPHGVVVAINLSNIHQDQGNFAAALSLLAEAEAEARELDEQNLIATCLTCVGGTRRALGDYPTAATALEQALALAREMGNIAVEAEALTNRGLLLLSQDRKQDARELLRQAAEVAEASQDYRLLLLARIPAAEAAGSTRELQLIVEDAETRGLRPVVAQARLSSARLHLAAGHPDRAGQEVQRAIEQAEPLHMRDILFQAHHLAARAFEQRGDRERALEQMTRAGLLLEEMLRGLDPADLERLEQRPETAAFRRDAEAWR